MITETTDNTVDRTFGDFRPMFLADWDRALFIHYAVAPQLLQPYVPFQLDMCPHDGLAYVSLVAFTQRRLRPWRLAGRFGRALSRPLSDHAFLNLRTYVKVDGEPGIHFLAEWIPNRLATLIGPPMYGLPYRLGALRYTHDQNRGELCGVVEARGRTFAYRGALDAKTEYVPAIEGSLDAFLLERYTAFTWRDGIARRFRIRHNPWRQTRVAVDVVNDSLLRFDRPWLANSERVGANYSPILRDVKIGVPERIAPSGEHSARAIVFYDAACGACTGAAARWQRTLGPRGFDFVPLQSPDASRLTGASPEALFAQMHLLTRDGRVLRGADAILHLAAAMRRTRPLAWAARIPGVRPLMSAAYACFARNRYRFSAACALPAKRHDSSTVRFVPPAVAVVLTLMLGKQLPPWAYMSAIAITIFGGCKWMTWWPYRRRAAVGRSIAYLFAWPGMDAAAFLDDRAPVAPTRRDIIEPALKFAIGAACAILIPPLLLPAHPLLAGWSGMLGLISMLHFGLFHLIALAWQRAGIDAQPLMQRPSRATSLGDFWGRRWNSGFRALTYEFLFRPLRRPLGASSATVIVFVVSGVLHELAITVPARGGYGGPTIYFLIELAGLLVERTRHARRIMTRLPLLSRAFTVAFTLAPLPLLFPRAFVERVMLPMVESLAAISTGVHMPSLKTLLLIAGVLHLGIISAGVVMTLVLDWRRNLAPLCDLTRHVIWAHATFVLLTIVGIGAVSMCCAEPLARGDPLARAVCAFIATFWTIRLAVQFFVFDAKPFIRGHVLLALGYHALTVVFAYFALVYSAAAFAPRG